MKRQWHSLYLLFCLVITSFFQVKAQSVGVGTTTPDASAILDVSGTSGGLLVPRLTFAQRDAIANPARGLVIFCSSDTSFYCYDGAWKRLAPAEHVWSLQGNTGTNSGNNFIGTKDTAALSFAINNIPRLQLDNEGRLNLIGTGDNIAIGFHAGYSNQTGNTNTFIGNSAGYSNTTGESNLYIGHRTGENSNADRNLFIGVFAGLNNSLANENTFIGYQAGYSNTSGQQNQFFGYAAGLSNTTGFLNNFDGFLCGYQNTTGSHNHFSGHGAGTMNFTGSRNTLIGSNADVTEGNLTNAGAIGYAARVSQSNSFVIGGTGVNAVNVGIGTTAPAFTLHVNGSVAGIGVYNNLSDSRLKKSILSIKNALARIMQLEPVSYNWKKEEYPQFKFDDKRQIGFLAQELEKIFPEAVTLGADGFYTISYSTLIPVVVQGIKEQQQQLNELRQFNEQLKTVLEMQAKEIELLKNKISTQK